MHTHKVSNQKCSYATGNIWFKVQEHFCQVNGVLLTQPSLAAFRVIVTTFNLLIRVHQHDFPIFFVSHRTILKAMYFVPATRLFVWSGLGRPEAVWFIKTCSYSISSHDYCFYFKLYNVG